MSKSRQILFFSQLEQQFGTFRNSNLFAPANLVDWDTKPFELCQWISKIPFLGQISRYFQQMSLIYGLKPRLRAHSDKFISPSCYFVAS